MDSRENVMKQSMYKLLDNVGKGGSYDVGGGSVVITGVSEGELDECLRLMEEPDIETSVEEEDGETYKVTAYYMDM